VSLVAHAALVWAIRRLPGANGLALAVAPERVIAVDLAPPPAPRAPAVRPAVRARPRAASRSPRAPAPAVTSAALTPSAEPDAPIDLAAQGFVMGSSSVAAGGSAAATAPEAPPAAAGPDRSRRATLQGGAQWACPFPAEAGADRIATAAVALRIGLDARGDVVRVTVVDDPGHGFGRLAEQCVRQRRWSPAFDRDGRPVAGEVALRVRFER
jgi:protein TonB